jgi:NADH-quinone oxidoreductase subunit L
VLPHPEGEHGAGIAFTLLLLSAVVAIAGVVLAWYVYGRAPVRAASVGVPRNPVHKLLIEKYYVDELYDLLFVQPIYRLSLWLARVFDPTVVDGLVNGTATTVLAWARGLRLAQTGYVMNYALGILVGAVAMVAYLLARQ